MTKEEMKNQICSGCFETVRGLCINKDSKGEWVCDNCWDEWEKTHALTGEKIHECIICKGDIEHKIDPATGRVYWTQGHNAQPVADGRCCDVCNATAVMTARLSHIFGDRAASVANALASTPKPTPCTAFRKGDDPRYECTCAKCRAVFEEGEDDL